MTQTGVPTYSGPPTSQGFFNGTGMYDIYLTNLIPAGINPATMDYLFLLLPTLPGSTAINLCSIANSCDPPGAVGATNISVAGFGNQYGGGDGPLLSGQLTPAIAATPEPSSIALLATGLLGGAGVLRRRTQSQKR